MFCICHYVKQRYIVIMYFDDKRVFTEGFREFLHGSSIGSFFVPVEKFSQDFSSQYENSYKIHRWAHGIDSRITALLTEKPILPTLPNCVQYARSQLALRNSCALLLGVNFDDQY